MQEIQTRTLDETETVEVEHIDTVRFRPADGGWRATVTDAMKHLGLEADMIATENDPEGVDVGIRFNEPDPDHGQLTGVLVTDDNLEGGRTYRNQRKVWLSGTAMNLVLSEAMLNNAGIECDRESDVPPVAEMWAGEGVFILKSVEMRDIEKATVNHELDRLPDQMREDWIAVEVEGQSPAEVADERGLKTPEPSPETVDKTYQYPGQQVKENVKKANKILDDRREDAIEAVNSARESEEALFKPAERSVITTTAPNVYSLSVTDTIRQALDDDVSGEDAVKVSLKFDPDAAADGVVPAHVLTGDGAMGGHGKSLVRKVNAKEPAPDYMPDDGELTPEHHRYSVKLPEAVISELGYDPDDPVGEHIATLTSDGAVAFEPNQKDVVEVTPPELKKSIRAAELEGHSGNNWYLEDAIEAWQDTVDGLRDSNWANTLRDADVEDPDGRETIADVVANDIPATKEGRKVQEEFENLRRAYEGARYVDWDGPTEDAPEE